MSGPSARAGVREDPALPGLGLVAGALILALAATALLWAGPVLATPTFAGPGQVSALFLRETSLQRAGLLGWLALLVPLLCCAAPLLWRDGDAAVEARVTGAALLLGFIFLVDLTVGILYVPSLVGLALAAWQGHRRRAPSRAPVD